MRHRAFQVSQKLILNKLCPCGAPGTEVDHKLAVSVVQGAIP